MRQITLLLFVVTCLCALQYSYGWFGRSRSGGTRASVSVRRSWPSRRSSYRSYRTYRSYRSYRGRYIRRTYRGGYRSRRVSVLVRRSWPSRRRFYRSYRTYRRYRSYRGRYIRRIYRGGYRSRRVSVFVRRSWPSRRRFYRSYRTYRSYRSYRGRYTRRSYRGGSHSRRRWWSKLPKTISDARKTFKSSKLGKFFVKYGDYIKLGKKLAKGKYIGATLIGAEIAAKAYLKRHPNTKLGRAIQKAIRFGNKHKMIKYVYKAAKKYLKRDARNEPYTDLEEGHQSVPNIQRRDVDNEVDKPYTDLEEEHESVPNIQRRDIANEVDKPLDLEEEHESVPNIQRRDVDNEVDDVTDSLMSRSERDANNTKKMPKSNNPRPCEFVAYDVDNDGHVTENEFKFYVSKTGIVGDDILMEEIDANDDGVISQIEFKDFLRSMSHIPSFMACL